MKSTSTILSEKKFIYIIGSPKSGTTWLQAMVAAHPKVATTVELTLFNRYIHPWLDAWDLESKNIEEGRWSQGLPYIMTRKEFYGLMREFIARSYQKVLELNPHASHILDKHPQYAFHVDEINLFIPRSRFIHVIRDGRDVAVSMVSARKHIGYGTGNIKDSAEAWKCHVLEARTASKFKGRYMEVRYEDLLENGSDVLSRVFQFCNLDITDSKTRDIYENHHFSKMKSRRQHADRRARTHVAFFRKGKAGAWKDDMSDRERYIFDRDAGKLLEELQYGEKGWWSNSFLQKVYLPFSVSCMGKLSFIKRVLISLCRSGR
jgi:hypothetical protein